MNKKDLTGLRFGKLTVIRETSERAADEGITVCDEWKNNYSAFRDWALSAGYESGLSLDRIDPRGNYCPENCRWVSLDAQQRNKRSNINIEINGENKTLAEWTKIFNMPYSQVWARIKRGWEPHRALTEPIRKLNK